MMAQMYFLVTNLDDDVNVSNPSFSVFIVIYISAELKNVPRFVVYSLLSALSYFTCLSLFF